MVQCSGLGFFSLFEGVFSFVSFLVVILLRFFLFLGFSLLRGRADFVEVFSSILKQLRAVLSFERATKLRSLILDLSQEACRYQEYDSIQGNHPEQPCLGSQYRACTESMESSLYLIITYWSNSFWLLA